MTRPELEEKSYRFTEMSQFQCKVLFRTTSSAGIFLGYRNVFFDSWPNPRPLPKVWGLALAEAQRDFVARRLTA